MEFLRRKPSYPVFVETTYEYDDNGRLKKTTDPMGHITQTEYDFANNVTKTIDGKNKETTYTYNWQNKLKSVTNPLSETTEYEYDLAGNLTRQEEAGGRVVTYTYNVRGLPITKTEGTLSEAYAYYPDGKLQTKTSKGGIVTEYTYDVHGNVLSEDAGGEEYTYTYDENGNVLTQTDLTGTTTRVYDELNRVTSKTVPVIGNSTFNYDILTGYGMVAGEHAERTTDPKGNVTIKVFDKVGRLLKVYDSELATPTVYAYDKAGRRTNLVYPTGEYVNYAYDNDDKLIILQNFIEGVFEDEYAYTYDANHNQLTKNETINNVVKGQTTYTYDDLNRLSTVTEPSGRVTTYSYDNAGNRSTEQIVVSGNTTLKTYYYDTATNRLTQMLQRLNGVLKITENYVYDNDGNLTSKTTINHENSTQAVVEYDYNNRNELTLSTSGSDTVTNSYNAEGLRVSKVSYTGGVTTTERYLYEGSDIILTINASNVQAARNVWGINLISRDGGTKVYMLYNGHKDVTALVDETGVIVGTYYYDAFGVVLSKTGTSDNPYGYSGYEYDDETGLYYLKARFYDPATARFLQEDTYAGDVSDPLSLNLYVYCSNNPIIYWDSSGHIEAGDEYYDEDTQAKILEYTDNYYNATTDEERDYWHNQAELARQNGTKYSNTSHALPVVNEFIKALGYSTNYNPNGSTFLSSDDWYTKIYNDFVFSNVDILNNLANSYTSDPAVAQQLVLQFIRNGVYDGPNWDMVAGEVDEEFIKYATKAHPELAKFLKKTIYIYDPKSGQKIDFTHLSATLNVLMYDTTWKDAGFQSLAREGNIDNLGGWAGDLQSFIPDVQKDTNNSNDYSTVYKSATKLLGDESTNFGMADLLSDVDAVNIKNVIGKASIGSALRDYYKSGYKTRYISFVKNTTGRINRDGLRKTVGPYTDEWFKWPFKKWPLLKDVNVTSNQSKAIRDAFTDFIWRGVESEK